MCLTRTTASFVRCSPTPIGGSRTPPPSCRWARCGAPDAASVRIDPGLISTIDVQSELSRRMHQLDERDRTLLFLWYGRQLAVTDIRDRFPHLRRHCFRLPASAIRRSSSSASRIRLPDRRSPKGSQPLHHPRGGADVEVADKTDTSSRKRSSSTPTRRSRTTPRCWTASWTRWP